MHADSTYVRRTFFFVLSPVTGHLKNMGIEQEAHQRLSKPSAIYCGGGSSKPERIFSLPFSKPSGSVLVGALMGESRVLRVAVFVLTTNRLMGGDFACFAIQRSRRVCRSSHRPSRVPSA